MQYGMRDDGEMKNERGFRTTMMIGKRDYKNRRNFWRMASMLGGFFEYFGDRWGQLRLILVEYELLAAVEGDVRDDVEVRWEARRARPSSC